MAQISVKFDTGGISDLEKKVIKACKQSIKAEVENLVPFETGDLRDSANPSYNDSTDEIHWTTPYAQKQYFVPMRHSGARTDHWVEHVNMAKVARRIEGILD